MVSWDGTMVVFRRLHPVAFVYRLPVDNLATLHEKGEGCLNNQWLILALYSLPSLYNI